MKATIIVKDEVNCKIQGLSLPVRKKLSDMFKYEIPGARYMPAVRLGRWDGKIAFFQLGGSTFINLLPDIIPVLVKEGYEVELKDTRDYSWDISFDTISEDSYSDVLWPEGHEAAGSPILLRDYQVDAINEFLENPQSIQEIATGAGKAQPLSAKIKTPTGWTTMGDIQPNDVVSTPDGKMAKVISVHPQGKTDVYEITTRDGRKTKCCGNHLWTVYNKYWARYGSGWKTLTINEIINLPKTSRNELYIPNIIPPMEEDKPLPIDPYFLGVILGDGCTRHGNISISSGDEHIINQLNVGEEYRIVKKPGNNNVDYNIVMEDEIFREKRKKVGFQREAWCSMKNIFRDLGLMNKLSNEKFIPSVFKNASYSQKIRLIQGLMDTDGYVSKNSHIVYSTISKQLANDFIEIIRSIGGICILKTKKPTYSYNNVKKQGQLCYNITVRFPKPKKLFTLPRKLNRITDNYQYSNLRVRIDNIVKIDDEETKCIYIDSPKHLYITDDYIVTHNTLITAIISHQCEKFGRTVVIVPNKTLVTQTEEDYINLGLDVGVIYQERKEYNHQHLICTWQSLGNLLKDKSAKHGFTIDDVVDGVACVMVDEAHSAKADILKQLLSGPFARVPIRIGLTGTVPKEEYARTSLKVCLGDVVGEISASDLQEKGVLANCHVNILQLIDTVEHTNYQSELKYLLSNTNRLEYIAEIISKASESGNTLVLVDRVQAGKDLVEMINKYLGLERAAFISGSTKAKDRKEHYDDIREVDGKIIVATYGVAAVGINLPRIFNLVLLEPGKSFVRVIQSIGRGIRKAKDKDFVQIYDITSTCKFAKRHLTKRKKFYREANYGFVIEKVQWK